LRHGLNHDLGFSPADRVENIRRAGEVARLMVDAGLIVICAFISPYEAERGMVRSMVGTDEFLEIFVDTPLDVLEARDPKGLYAKARVGKITNFTGIDAPYEVPTNPDLRIDTTTSTVDVSAEAIVDVLTSRRIIDT
jgi:bifunctional enzyme CysN/CysC